MNCTYMYMYVENVSLTGLVAAHAKLNACVCYILCIFFYFIFYILDANNAIQNAKCKKGENFFICYAPLTASVRMTINVKKHMMTASLQKGYEFAE